MSTESTTEVIALAKFIDGPTLAGIFMNVMLYGVMMTQTLFYFSTYTSDPKWMKYYVGFLIFADTLNTVFNEWFIYNVVINNFGNSRSVIIANWLFETEEAMTGIIGMQVQMLYAWRIYKLANRKWVVVIIVASSIIGGLGGIAAAVVVGFKPIFTQFTRYKEVVIIWLGAAALADILITTSLVWFLHKKRTGFHHTDTMISRIIQITVSNGLLTASFAIADIVAFLADTGGMHLAFNYTLCKLYGNSVMSSLNSRVIVTPNTRIINSTFHAATQGREVDDFVSSRATQVVVNVETHEMVDVNGRVLKGYESSTGSPSDDFKTEAV